MLVTSTQYVLTDNALMYIQHCWIKISSFSDNDANRSSKQSTSGSLFSWICNNELHSFSLFKILIMRFPYPFSSKTLLTLLKNELLSLEISFHYFYVLHQSAPYTRLELASTFHLHHWLTAFAPSETVGLGRALFLRSLKHQAYEQGFPLHMGLMSFSFLFSLNNNHTFWTKL